MKKKKILEILLKKKVLIPGLIFTLLIGGVVTYKYIDYKNNEIASVSDGKKTELANKDKDVANGEKDIKSEDEKIEELSKEEMIETKEEESINTNTENSGNNNSYSTNTNNNSGNSSQVSDGNITQPESPKDEENPIPPAPPVQVKPSGRRIDLEQEAYNGVANGMTNSTKVFSEDCLSFLNGLSENFYSGSISSSAVESQALGYGYSLYEQEWAIDKIMARKFVNDGESSYISDNITSTQYLFIRAYYDGNTNKTTLWVVTAHRS